MDDLYADLLILRSILVTAKTEDLPSVKQDEIIRAFEFVEYMLKATVGDYDDED